MTVGQLAVLTGLLMLGGGFVAHRATRWAAGRLERNVALAIAVCVWTIAAGLLPFAAFGLLVRGGTAGSLGGFESLVFNLLPFVLLAAPLVGYVHGMVVTRRGS